VPGARGIDLRVSPWPEAVAQVAGGGCLRGTALGSGRSSGAVGVDVGVGLSAEVKASGRVGG
jgi:hypothetical protein